MNWKYEKNYAEKGYLMHYEDCGGSHGYYNVLKTLSDPKHPDHEAMRTWAGENWDPEQFNKDEVKFDNPYKRWKIAFMEP